MAEYVTNNIYCNLTLVREDFDKGVLGIVTPKQWLYAQDPDVAIFVLERNRFYGELKTKNGFRRRLVLILTKYRLQLALMRRVACL